MCSLVAVEVCSLVAVEVLVEEHVLGYVVGDVGLVADGEADVRRHRDRGSPTTQSSRTRRALGGTDKLICSVGLVESFGDGVGAASNPARAAEVWNRPDLVVVAQERRGVTLDDIARARLFEAVALIDDVRADVGREERVDASRLCPLPSSSSSLILGHVELIASVDVDVGRKETRRRSLAQFRRTSASSRRRLQRSVRPRGRRHGRRSRSGRSRELWPRRPGKRANASS